MKIMLENISKKYKDFTAVNNVSLSVEEGELLALLGSSGCGKTTLLRIIAGLIPHDEGKIYLNNQDISAWPAQKRNTAMVFQNYALFPHLTVSENVAFGLKVRKIPKKELHHEVALALEKFRLEGLGDRRVQELSGGQRQRAALARSLVIEPDILLFDEPLSNLDEKLRVSMRKEIRRIQKEINITSVYVTHDQREAMAIADHIAVMDQGEIRQIGTPEDIYYRPTCLFVAEFMGHPNIYELKPELVKSDGYVEFLGKSVEVDRNKKHTHLLLRPEEIEITDDGKEARVLETETLGAVIRCKLKSEGTVFFADFINRIGQYDFQVNDEIKINFDRKSIHLF
jgi:ABC-type Fe3+/spermidine/putrescine transport system ATPase subunit